MANFARKLRVRTRPKLNVLKPVRVETTSRRVFRIEHSVSKLGPFINLDYLPGNIHSSDAMYSLAEPCEMLGYEVSRSFIYGFDSVIKLDTAVRDWALLREMNFNISVYQSNNYILMEDGQVAFEKDTAQLVVTKPIDEFDFDQWREENRNAVDL